MAAKLKEKKITVRLPDGRTARKSIYYRSAAELAAKIQAAHKEQQELATFGAVAEAWRDTYFETIAHGTQMSYSPAVDRAIAEFGSLPLEKVIPRDLQEYYDSMVAQGYSRQTIHVQRLVIGLIFKYACVEYGLPANPNRETSLPKKTPPPQKTPILEDEEAAIVTNGLSLPFGLFPYLLMYSGLRRGEALALTWGDIDLTTDRIRVNKAVEFRNNRALLKDTKTSSGVREVPIVAPLHTALASARHRAPASAPVFPGVDGDLLSEKAYQWAWKSWRQASGYTGNTRSLRHLFATYCFEAGVQPKDAQALLGHSSIDMTMNVYTEIRAQRANVQKATLDTFFTKSVV